MLRFLVHFVVLFRRILRNSQYLQGFGHNCWRTDSDWASKFRFRGRPFEYLAARFFSPLLSTWSIVPQCRRPPGVCICCPLCLAFLFSPGHLAPLSHQHSASFPFTSMAGPHVCTHTLSMVPVTWLVTCLCPYLTMSFLTMSFCFFISMGFLVPRTMFHVQQVLSANGWKDEWMGVFEICSTTFKFLSGSSSLS